MPIVAADLIKYGSASRPEDDVSTSGGAIDADDRPVFTQMTANAVIAVVSDGADTRTVTVYGRLASGARDSEALVLNGAVEVIGAKTFERLLRVVAASASGTRTVTVKQGSGGSTLGTIPINEIGFYALFIDSASESGATVRYEKVFWRNAHATLTLNSAKVTLTADPSAKIKIALATAKNDSVSVANRKTSPGLSFSDDGVELTVPGGTLEAASAIGTWVEMSLAGDDPPVRSTFTTRLAGTSV